MRIAPWQLLLVAAMLKACATTPLVDPHARRPLTEDTIDDAVPRAEPLSKYGNPPSYVVEGKTYRPLRNSRDYTEQGTASWYGEDFHGKRTSSGEPYDMYAMTAAHRVLPLPSYVEVTNTDNGRRAVVRVNDRGPFRKDRVLDLSYAAAVKLGVVENGTAHVRLRALTPGADEDPSDARDDRFFVQVGAFSSEPNAQRLRDRLLRSPLDTPVNVSRVVHDEKPLFRVRVGPVADREAVRGVVARLGRLGIVDTHIIVE
ncbi:MAG: septal ring lytic transglycosylase RlpA family protein [Gammaproteobacteria bacterium]|nr:septal ring lytic transglycosylase RlpA family protein [Gammaproteobacteria bacterium]